MSGSDSQRNDNESNKVINHHDPPAGFDVGWDELHALLDSLENKGYSLQKFNAQSSEDKPEKSYSFVVEQNKMRDLEHDSEKCQNNG